MRAIAIHHYGGPESLELVDMPDPLVGPDVVLVEARAAGVNPVDATICKGGMDARYPCHFPLIPGWDVAGVVREVGPAVYEWEPGDEVVGYVRRDHVQWGTYAELVPAPVRTLARKPAGLAWTAAASLPLAGLTAWQVLHRVLDVGEEDTVLIHAAAGGVGTMAVQLARALGAARVIGTASKANHEHLRSLGAEPVTYGRGLEKQVKKLAPKGVTAIFDAHGGEGLEVSPKLLAEDGRIASIKDPTKVKELGGAYWFVRPDPGDLTTLCRMVEQGSLAVHGERTFPLEKAAEAHELIAGGHMRGKVALEIG